MTKTVVLDDDPTGTQSASDVTVLFDATEQEIAEVLATDDAVFLQTNTRSLEEPAAVALVSSLRSAAQAAAESLGADVRFVLRGDSTLRGHVFAETDAFLDGDPSEVVVFCPAFPAGGRRTIEGVHYVTGQDGTVRADETEFAADPVFPFDTADLVEYVARKSALGHPHDAVSVTLDEVRDGRITQVLATAGPGTVVVPDIEEDDDVRAVADAVRAAERAGRRVVIRSAAPLAAELAGVASHGFVQGPVLEAAVPTLLAVGSHTALTTSQLDAVTDLDDVAEIDTERALDDPDTAGRAAADLARPVLASTGFAVVASARSRRADHDTLDHGAKVMAALTTAVRALLPDVGLVIAKGGITSSEVARVGVGARRARVLGQLVPGVSLWRTWDHGGRELLYVVLPGNIGDRSTISDVLAIVRPSSSTPTPTPSAPTAA